MKAPIKAINSKIVAKLIEPKTETESGILLGSTKEKPNQAEVLSVGDKVKSVKVGNKIVFKDYSTTDFKIAGENYLIIDEDDILGILEDK